MKYQTPDALEALIKYIVSLDSRSGTQGEIDFPYYIKTLLSNIDYFSKNPEHIQLHDAGNDLNALTALYDSKAPNAKTIVVMSHFDTVHTNDFGDYEPLAFDVDALTKTYSNTDDWPQDVADDIASGNYLFGRGIMDMKMGLALHIRLIEYVSAHNLPCNILLLTVPDEEVDSKGMRHATTVLNEQRDTHNLTYGLILNSEPSFMQQPNDPNYYIYTGSIGKIMPAALSYGAETHVGEPLKGINALFMASTLNRHMEYQTLFSDQAYDTFTPLPITLRSDDLKTEYSTQVTHRVGSIYNVFTMKKSANEVFQVFNQVVENAVADMTRHYEHTCMNNNVTPTFSIETFTYETLVEKAHEKLGQSAVEKIIRDVTDSDKDLRQQSFEIVERLMYRMKELSPAVVTLFAPPYYPPVNNTEDELVQELIVLTQKYIPDVKVMHYFNGISDLSYVSYQDSAETFKDYINNTPVYGTTYHIPFDDMKALDTPFINIGPYGKDPHKYTERLNKKSAFETMPKLLEALVERFF